MAVACGHTKPLPAKSLLTSLEGFKTFTIALEEGQPPMTETRAVFPLLRKVTVATVDPTAFTLDPQSLAAKGNRRPYTLNPKP